MKHKLKTYSFKDTNIFWRCCQKVFLWCFLSASCFAQNPQLEDLKERLKQHSAKDSIRTNMLLEIVDAYHLFNKDSMFRYCELLLNEARQSNNSIQLAQANKVMGIYLQNAQPSESMNYFRQALEAYKEAGKKDEVVIINNMMAATYFLMNDYNKQLLHLRKALQDVLELDNQKLEIDILHQISEACFYLGNYELAEEYSLMALQESRKQNDWMLIQIMMTQAEIEFRKGNYRHSIELSEEVLARVDENGQLQVEIASMCNIAECLIGLKQYREARTMLEKCQKTAGHDDASFDDYKILQLMATLDFVTGNYANAFSKQRQLEQLLSKKYSLEQLQNNSDKTSQTELQHLRLKLSELQMTYNGLENQTAKMNGVLISFGLVACGGCCFLVFFRRSFKNLKIEKDILLKKRTSIIEKQDRLSNKYQTLLQESECLEGTHQRMVKSDRSKTELFKAMSSDLQMPLVRLQQDLNDLMLTNVDETLFKQATTELTNRVGGISLLLENLLQWSRFQSQGMQTKPQYTELLALVNEVIGQQKYSAAERKVSIYNMLEQNIFVYADEEMVRSSLKAMLQNIVKLSKSKATISISGKKDKQKGWLNINYTGQMPLKQMFLEQSQADSYGSETSELGKAICLGWMLCRTLLKANHGNIEIEDISAESFNIILYFPLEESASNKNI